MTANIVFFVVAVAFLALAIYVMCKAEIEDKKLLEMMRADDAKQAEEDARERRRMLHQADLEKKRQDNNAFRGLGVTPHNIWQIGGELHEADSKPVSTGQVGGVDPTIAAALVGARLQQATNAYNTDGYRRRLNAGITNHRGASMEPFCGEGRKP